MKKFGSSNSSAFTSPQSEKETTDMECEDSSASTITASAIEHNPFLKADTAVGELLQYREPARSSGYCPDTNVIFPAKLFAYLTTESEAEHNKTSSSKYNIEDYMKLHIELDFLYGRAMHMATQHHFVVETIVKKIIEDFKPFFDLSEGKSTLPKWLKQMIVIHKKDNPSETIDHILSMDINDLSDTHDYLYKLHKVIYKNLIKFAEILSEINKSEDRCLQETSANSHLSTKVIQSKKQRKKHKEVNSEKLEYLKHTLHPLIEAYSQKSWSDDKSPDKLDESLDKRVVPPDELIELINLWDPEDQYRNVVRIHRWNATQLDKVTQFLKGKSDFFQEKIDHFCQELLKNSHFLRQFPQLIGKTTCVYTATIDQHFINLSFRPSSTTESYDTVKRWLHKSYPAISFLSSKSFYDKTDSEHHRNDKKRSVSFDRLIKSYEHLGVSRLIGTLYESVLRKSEVFRQQRVSFLHAQISLFFTRLEQIEKKLDAAKVDSPTSVIPTEQTIDMFSKRTIKSTIKAIKNHIARHKRRLSTTPTLKPSAIIEIENELSEEFYELRHACLTMHFCEKNIIVNLLTENINQPLAENSDSESNTTDKVTACDLTLFKKTDSQAPDTETTFKNPTDHKLDHEITRLELAQPCV